MAKRKNNAGTVKKKQITEKLEIVTLENALSDAYETPDKEPRLELKVLTLNMNEGHNKELMEQCQTLKEYAKYVALVRKYKTEMKLDAAVKCAVDECIQSGIPAEFLKKNRAEVIAVSIFEYDKEEEEKKLRKAEYEAGYDDGKKLGITEGEIRKAKETAIELTKVGMAKSQIAAILKVNENMLRQWLEK